MSNELDKHFKEKLGHYASDVDAEAIWAAVQPPQHRRRRLLLWWLLPALLIGGGAVWMWYDTTPTAVPHAPATTAQATAPVAATTVDHAAASHQRVPHTTTPAPTQSAQSAQQNTAAPQHRTAAAVSSAGTPPSATAPKRLTGGAAMAQQATMAQDAQWIDNQPIGLSGQSEVVATAPPAAIQSVAENTTQSSTSSTAENLPTDITTRANAGVASPIASLPLLPLAVVRADVLPTAIPAAQRRRHQPYFMQLDATYHTLRQKLATDSFPDWVAQRQSSERPLEALTLDLTAGYLHKTGWQVRVGLGYTRINTEMNSSITRVSVDSVEGLKCIVFLPYNAVDSVYGNVGVTITNTSQWRTFNSFRQVEVPVLVGYQWGAGAWTVLAEGGVRLRLSRTQEGRILAQDGVSIADLATLDTYRSGLGYSLQAGLTVGYAFHPQMRVQAGVVWQYHPQDFTTAEAKFSENYRMLGFSLGGRYVF